MHKKTEVWSRIEARDRENVYTLYRNIWIYIEKNLPNYIFTDFCFAKIRRGKKKSRGENVCVIIFRNLQKKNMPPTLSTTTIYDRYSIHIHIFSLRVNWPDAINRICHLPFIAQWESFYRQNKKKNVFL